MLTELPANQRIAVVLRHVVGLPIIEVAAAMGCPEGTAKSHVSRGLQRLREIYAAAPVGGGVVTPLRSHSPGVVPRARRAGYPSLADRTAPRGAVGRKHR
jgi:RNA polymerase sigma-70 factor (ECF subfamily)